MANSSVHKLSGSTFVDGSSSKLPSIKDITRTKRKYTTSKSSSIAHPQGYYQVHDIAARLRSAARHDESSITGDAVYSRGNCGDTQYNSVHLRGNLGDTQHSAACNDESSSTGDAVHLRGDCGDTVQFCPTSWKPWGHTA